MTKINYEELFSIGENTQELAEPAADSTAPEDEGEDGEKEQESAESAAGANTHENETEREDTSVKENAQSEEQAPENKTQTREERAKNAAARRKAELEAAVEKARAEEQARAKKQLDDFFAKAGFVNTLENNKPIKSIDDYTDYKTQLEADKFQQNLKAGNLTTQELENKIADITKKVMKEAELEQTGRARVQSDLEQISKLDPTISSVDDLLKMDTAREFYSYVKKGNSFLEAFRLANFDRLTKNAQAAAQQQALNKANSKSHLTGTATRGVGATTVPSEEMSLYRELNPGLSEEEILKHYNQYKKQK